jgi:hypothetical protein
VAAVRTIYTSLVLLLAGCGFGLQPTTAEGIAALLSDTDDGGGFSSTDADADADADVDADVQPEIDSIEPDWGTTAGGTEVILTGTFGEDATVRVGGVEADNKSVQYKRGKLVFFTPEVGDEGVVSIVLESNGQSAKADEAFTYYADGAGLVGAVGAVSWIDIVGNYWSDTPVDYGYAFFVPITPAEFDWNRIYSGSQDACETSKGTYTYTPDAYVIDVGGGSSATLTSASKSIRMPWNATDGQFADNELTAAEYGANNTYDLSEVSFTGDEIPEFTVNGMVQTPASFSVSAPAIGGSSVVQVSQSFALSWTGGTAGDGVLVTLQLMAASGLSVDETVTCSLRDDGSFNGAGSTFRSWPTGRQLNIVVARYDLADATIAYNNASTAVLGEYVIYGAAFTK